VALKDHRIPGYDKRSVWAQLFGRDDRVARLLKTMLDEEKSTYRRFMENACRVTPPAVDHAMA
jgi:ferritin-like metal-binding protein YciE